MLATLAAISSALDLRGAAEGGACSATAMELAAADRFSICDDVAASVRSAMTVKLARLVPICSSKRATAASALARPLASGPGTFIDGWSAIRGVTVAA